MESTIRIERYADQGRCVGHIDGRVVFVRFALPGELVRVVLDEPHDREDRFWTGIYHSRILHFVFLSAHNLYSH